MKSVEQTAAYLAERIGYIYYHPRPLMYGGTADGVDLLLWNYHEIWSELVEKQEEFRTVLRNVLDEAECDAAGFPTRYLMEHPDAAQEETAKFVIKQWRMVSDRLAIPIAHERLKSEFAECTARVSASTR